jgi:hypothetical protein
MPGLNFSSQQQMSTGERSSRIGTAQVYEASSQSPRQLVRRILAEAQTHEIGTQSPNHSAPDNNHPWDQSSSSPLLNQQHIYQPPQFDPNSNSLFTSPTAYYVTRGGRTTQRQLVLDSGGSPTLSLLPRQLGSSNGAPSSQSRPQFRSKVVCVLDCKHCSSQVCRRGMKAILLADMNVGLKECVKLIKTGRIIFYRCTSFR